MSNDEAGCVIHRCSPSPSCQGCWAIAMASDSPVSITGTENNATKREPVVA